VTDEGEIAALRRAFTVIEAVLLVQYEPDMVTLT
jgi:hypothetical protein